MGNPKTEKAHPARFAALRGISVRCVRAPRAVCGRVCCLSIQCYSKPLYCNGTASGVQQHTHKHTVASKLITPAAGDAAFYGDFRKTSANVRGNSERARDHKIGLQNEELPKTK